MFASHLNSSIHVEDSNLSYRKSVDSKNELLAKNSWRHRPAAPQERFYLGDDESDASDDECRLEAHANCNVADTVYAAFGWPKNNNNNSSYRSRDNNNNNNNCNGNSNTASKLVNNSSGVSTGTSASTNSISSADSVIRNRTRDDDDDDGHPACFLISSEDDEEEQEGRANNGAAYATTAYGGNNIGKDKNFLESGALRLAFDEDSGLGGSTPNSANEDEASDRATELVPLRVFIPAVAKNKKAYPAGGRKLSKKNQFYENYKMADDHLGAGAYACVRTCVSLKSDEEFAVKLVDKREPGHTRSRIFREVEIFKLCRNHPNIVQLVEWFEDEIFFYMVFEKMRGGQLLDHIQRKVCFTEQEASQVTRDIAQALKHLHDRGIAHRDVKPENILCTDFSRVSPVKLCDLDLASKPNPTAYSNGKTAGLRAGKYGSNSAQRAQDVSRRVNHFSDETLTTTHAKSTPRTLPNVASEPDLASPVGSAEFMAPEVVDAFVGESFKYDKRCDMWSLGVIVYIMLCGYPPFYGECERKNCGWDQGQACSDCQENLFHRIQRGEFDFPEEEWGEISEEAKDLICHLLVRNVRQRYTADDVLRHRWVADGAPRTPLQTPSNLFRNDSARDMHQMNQVFQVYQHLNQPEF